MIRIILVLFLSTTLAQADPVSDWIARQDSAHQWALSSIHADEALMGYAEACPADVFPARGRRASGASVCRRNPSWCLTLCRAGNGNACFGVARTIETEMADPGEATLKFPMFMAACADGNANGCTNAAATAKNGSWIKGTRPARAQSRACQFRTYKAACAAGASWGCYMLGMEWAYEGVDGQKDTAKARTAWQRSCDISPNGSSCSAAQAQLARE